MPGSADMTRSLAYFRRCSEVADALERYKHVAVYGRAGYRAIARCATKNCEDALDAAWRVVGLISADFGDMEARLVAGHYLFLEPWRDVAAEAGISIYQAKWRAYKALGWLEGKYGNDEKKGEAAPRDARRGGADTREGDGGERGLRREGA